MLSKIKSSTVIGIQAFPIVVEVDCCSGLPTFNIVGLGDSAVKESRDRVFSALRNSDFLIPNKRMVVNLAPAYMKKMGSSLDLPIALGLLVASEQIKIQNQELESTLVLGELSLDGGIRPVQGCLATCLYAYKHKIKKVYLPYENFQEVDIIKDVNIIPVKNILELILYLKGKEVEKPVFEKKGRDNTNIKGINFSEVRGQSLARRACEISVAGSHHFLFIGSPGCGKSMMAKRIPTIFPEMSLEESLEATMIHSSAGALPVGSSLLLERPFRSPHHNISQSALVGGGAYPKPGEVSLAHHGVLFLDELGEFRKDHLNVLRQPLEDFEITISRTQMTLKYPSRFIFGAAMNPCPCGFLIDPYKSCTCPIHQVKNYLSKISGPLLDRIDLQVELTPLPPEDLLSHKLGESSEEIKLRIEKAWGIQKNRYSSLPSHLFNGHLGSRGIRQFCVLTEDAKDFLKLYISRNHISSRSHDRILKVSRTTADLAGSEKIQKIHLSEALQFRGLDQIKNYLG